MNAIEQLQLDRARPSDRTHLLAINPQHRNHLNHIAQHYNAQRIDYRHNLSTRLNTNTRYLSLHNHLDRELNALKAASQTASQTATKTQPPGQNIILLEHFDLLITYCQNRPGSPLSLLWQHLDQTRKLPAPLWIVLPPRLIPDTWNRDRLKTLTL